MSGDSFTLIVLPDTQYYSQDYPQIFLDQTRWIVDKANELNIQMVLHAGDVVNHPEQEQWHNAKEALDLLDEAGIPTVVTRMTK